MQGELSASKMITRKDYETSASLSLHGWLAIPYISDWDIELFCPLCVENGG